jgi:predicted nucleotidyltransferase
MTSINHELGVPGHSECAFRKRIVENTMKTLDQINLTPDDRTAVLKAVALLKDRFPVHRVVLFGSKARGQATQESDIDLLVLTSRPVNRQDKSQIRHALFDLQLERAVVFNTLIVPMQEWEHGLYQVLPIRQEIEKDGVAALEDYQ